MTTTFSRNTPEMIDLMKRRERTRGAKRTCRDCGVVALCKVDVDPAAVAER